jgi:predicted amino acid racemase
MTRIIVYLNKIAHNLRYAQELCQKRGLRLIAVTKCCGSDNIILQHLIRSGADFIADSRAYQLKNIGSRVKKIALQVPRSAIDDALCCDFAYVTEMNTLKAMSASPLSGQCQLIIPLEMGDLREGVPQDQIISFMQEALKAEHIRIAGFSANWGCMKWIPPDIRKIETFIKCVRQISESLNFHPQIISVGGSTLWSLLQENLIPRDINQIRLGETIFLGYDPGLKSAVEPLCQDTFILEPEIIEIKDKNIQEDFGARAIRRRAVLDFGYTSCPYTGLTPLQKGVELVGASQDHTVADITDAQCLFSVGDSLKFLMNYEALSRAMVSPYLEKIYKTNTVCHSCESRNPFLRHPNIAKTDSS